MPSIASRLVDAAQTHSREVDAMRFAAPVSHVYNPLDYAWAVHRAYLEPGGQSRLGAGGEQAVG